MTPWELIWNVISSLGSQAIVLLLVVALFVLVITVVCKKRSTLDKAREWFLAPMKKQLEEDKKDLLGKIKDVHIELVETRFNRLRRDIIMDVSFIKSSVGDGTWNEGCFTEYAHMVGDYVRLGQTWSLRDGEVIASLREVDKLYAQTHNGLYLFGEDMINDIQKILVHID